MMNNKQTLLAIMALAAAHSSSAFVVNTQARAISNRPLSYSTGDTMTNDYTDVTATTSEQSSKLIMDIPPTPVAPKNKPAPKKKPNATHKEGWRGGRWSRGASNSWRRNEARYTRPERAGGSCTASVRQREARARRALQQVITAGVHQ